MVPRGGRPLVALRQRWRDLDDARENGSSSEEHRPDTVGVLRSLPAFAVTVMAAPAARVPGCSFVGCLLVWVCGSSV